MEKRRKNLEMPNKLEATEEQAAEVIENTRIELVLENIYRKIMGQM